MQGTSPERYCSMHCTYNVVSESYQVPGEGVRLPSLEEMASANTNGLRSTPDFGQKRPCATPGLRANTRTPPLPGHPFYPFRYWVRIATGVLHELISRTPWSIANSCPNEASRIASGHISIYHTATRFHNTISVDKHWLWNNILRWRIGSSWLVWQWRIPLAYRDAEFPSFSGVLACKCHKTLSDSDLYWAGRQVQAPRQAGALSSQGKIIRANGNSGQPESSWAQHVHWSQALHAAYPFHHTGWPKLPFTTAIPSAQNFFF